MQIFVFYSPYKKQHFFEHIIRAVGGTRQVIGGIVFALMGSAHTPDVDLDRALEYRGFGLDMNIIHRLKMIYPARQIPYLCVHDSGAVLKSQGIIAFAAFCTGVDFGLAQINAADAVAFSEIFDINHMAPFIDAL